MVKPSQKYPKKKKKSKYERMIKNMSILKVVIMLLGVIISLYFSLRYYLQ